LAARLFLDFQRQRALKPARCQRSTWTVSIRLGHSRVIQTRKALYCRAIAAEAVPAVTRHSADDGETNSRLQAGFAT
jgi:hypothetical protein